MYVHQSAGNPRQHANPGYRSISGASAAQPAATAPRAPAAPLLPPPVSSALMSARTRAEGVRDQALAGYRAARGQIAAL